MKIFVKAPTNKHSLKSLKEKLGGHITERWGELELAVDNDNAKGSIRLISFDWGVAYIDFDITFFKDVELITDASEHHPIHFSYCADGYFEHRFDDSEEFKRVDQFHSAIITASSSEKRCTRFPKNTYLKINDIRIIRKEFLKKRSFNHVSFLNKKLYEVFVDSKLEGDFAFYGPISLKIAELYDSIKLIKSKGMSRILQIEGCTYQLLSHHIDVHNSHEKRASIPYGLTKKELKGVRTQAERILKNPSFAYSLESISRESGLSQAKLQEGFKFLYTRTVTEYIRHTRLEAARDLMLNTDLNISQIVYSIGFTSRSYFSKIFKEKYEMSPNEFKKNLTTTEDLEVAV